MTNRFGVWSALLKRLEDCGFSVRQSCLAQPNVKRRLITHNANELRMVAPLMEAERRQSIPAAFHRWGRHIFWRATHRVPESASVTRGDYSGATSAGSPP